MTMAPAMVPPSSVVVHADAMAAMRRRGHQPGDADRAPGPEAVEPSAAPRDGARPRERERKRGSSGMPLLYRNERPAAFTLGAQGSNPSARECEPHGMECRRLDRSRNAAARGALLAGFVAAGSLALSCAGPIAGEDSSIASTSNTRIQTHPASLPIPAPGESIRVGGDMSIKVQGRDGDYRAGPCRIDTPLPEGYPLPTPPGAIEIKSYPLVRRAVVSGTGGADSGMNRAFWPLFNHIKKHDIAMTSPVEVDYHDLENATSPNPRDWTMAFLYRSPEMNQPGVEGSVRVLDAEPVTVIAVGLKGDYSMDLVRRGLAEIDAWLAENPEWTPAGSWRALYYNGPSLFWWNKWAEVQRPVTRARS